MTWRRFASLVGIAVAAVVPIRAQRDPVLPQLPVTGTAVLAGVVVSDAEGAPPIRRVLVTLAGAGGSARTLTDDAGRFRFETLPSGRYTLAAEKAPFVKTYYGSPRIGQGPGAAIPLAEGQRLTALRVVLVRGAVIEGTLRDEAGVPLSSGQVRAQRVVVLGGERRLVDLPSPFQLATTDDRGVFRLYGLPSGEYGVSASGGGAGVAPVLTPAQFDEAARLLKTPGGVPAQPPHQPAQPQTFSRARSFHPGVTEVAQASTFTLAAGEERTGVDIVSRLVAVSPVSGRAFGPDGQSAGTDALIGLANLSVGSTYFSPGFVRPGPDATFRTPPIPSGRYLFYGQLSAAGRETSWLWEEVELGASELQGVVLQFRQGSAVSGRLIFPPDAPFPLQAVRVAIQQVVDIENVAARIPAVSVDSSGTFVFPSVPPGRYRLSVTGSGAWALKSAVANGQDALDTPFAVTAGTPTELVLGFTNQPTVLTGRLTDQLGRPAPDYGIVVFPVDAALRANAPRRLSGIVRLDTDASFSVTGLPPGDYFLAAITDLDALQVTDLSLLELMSAAAVRVRLIEGQRTVQDVRLGP